MIACLPICSGVTPFHFHFCIYFLFSSPACYSTETTAGLAGRLRLAGARYLP
jgi:hypothetical protein